MEPDTAWRLTNDDLDMAAGRPLTEEERDRVISALDAQDWTAVIVDAVIT